MKKKVYLLVTIDTECDKSINWDVKQPLSFKNIQLQETILMPIFRNFNIKPTYLLSPEVLKDKNSVIYFKSIEKEVELGTHLHIEFIDPNCNMESKTTNRVQKELDYNKELLKLTNLTNLFIDSFDSQPKSFRSGRFGSSDKTGQILSKLGYGVDSSVCPFKTHYFSNNFKKNDWGKPLEPYFEIYDDKKILQVPLTLINEDFQKLPKFILKRLESKSTLLKKILKKINYKSNTKWLRPYRQKGNGLIDICENVISNHFKKEEFVVLNIMFHSNEILVGGSPYCKTDKEVVEFQKSLEELFNYVSKKYEVCSIGLGELYGVYCQE